MACPFYRVAVADSGRRSVRTRVVETLLSDCLSRPERRRVEPNPPRPRKYTSTHAWELSPRTTYSSPSPLAGGVPDGHARRDPSVRSIDSVAVGEECHFVHLDGVVDVEVGSVDSE